MKVKYVYLDRQYSKLRVELRETMDDIMKRGAFILRPEVKLFENKISNLLSVSHTIGVNSGTDALHLGVRALKLPKGSEVITISHTYISTISALIHSGLKPILVDIGDDYNIDPEKISAVITKKTRAIFVTHMNGRICDMDNILKIANRFNLQVIEDAAQAIGATYKGKHSGSFGSWGAFSLHPMKILGGAGDGGLLTTNNSEIARDVKMMRNMGQHLKGEHESFEFNSRLDTLQAAICMVKLTRLDQWVNRRKELASNYTQAFKNIRGLVTPPNGIGGNSDVFSSYVIRSNHRNKLQQFLTRSGVETMISWTTPLHKVPKLGLTNYHLPKTDSMMKQILSLPIAPELSDAEQNYVIKLVKKFYE